MNQPTQSRTPQDRTSGGRPTAALEIAVHYPAGSGELRLRTELDWERDLEPDAVSPDGTRHLFRVPFAGTHLYFKPVLAAGPETRWSVGENFLAVAAGPRPREVYPYFFADPTCSACELRELPSPAGCKHHYRVFYPPGYAENTLKRYPVLYMQDGQNLFFPDEAYLGRHWRIAETLQLLTGMNALREVIVVGVYPEDRMRQYTADGYEPYGRFLVETLKPAIDAEHRTLTDPAHTGLMGSSLGGVVSFYLAWQWPEVFGLAACLSSTFGYRDDLRRRVAAEPRRPLRLYLDSGWPGDNYEVTRDLADLLVERGYRRGSDMLYLAFPHAAHDETAWSMRCHIPFQFLFAGEARNGRGPAAVAAAAPIRRVARPRPARTASR